ncbi:hypothetical protein BCR33DRAFT_718212 [Rhizoclosmatium globosum]|uniref:TIR domain-containing protein n=1 Tax=Rhizoclosmatium globosum TaxID=329046 RepID=A0A1Y2C6L7_9FUNG|nr:hypothetical protein BCR33DRAFT_718212 [Rhizoclosmatium globosum]|eukprot:ORY42517.1 hypothetical protein BCR33DRAFT_718212 [Rhizoclosmatium globosum]
MYFDAEETIALLLPTSPPISNVELRLALAEFKGKLPDDATVVTTIVFDHVLPLLRTNETSSTLQWHLDSLIEPLSALIDNKLFLEADGTGAQMLEVATLLIKAILVRPDNEISYDIADWYGYLADRILYSDVLNDYLIKEDPSSLPGLIALAAPLLPRYQYGVSINRLVRNAKYSLPYEINTKYDKNARKKDFDSIDLPVALALDASQAPQTRRSALQKCLKVIMYGQDSSATKQQKKLSGEALLEFSAIAATLVENQDFPLMADLFNSLIEAVNNRATTLNVKEKYDWTVDTLVALGKRFKAGDMSLLDGENRARTITDLLGLSSTHVPSRCQEGYAAIFEVLEKFNDSDITSIASCYYTAGENAKRGVMLHLDVLMRIARTGNQTAGSIPMMLIYSDKEAFLPFIDEIFESPTLLPTFIAVYRSEPKLFLDKLPQLLPLLQGSTTADSASNLIIGIVATQPEQYSTEEKVTEITDALKQSVAHTTGAIPYQVTRVWSSIATASDSGRDVCTPKIVDAILTLLNAPERHPEIGETIQQLLTPLASIATFHPTALKPYEAVLETIREDPVVQQGGVKESLDNVMNSLRGVSLAALSDKFTSSMKSLGINPDDPFFAAVNETLAKGDIKEYDCMLSYNWSQQPTVIRIRDSLVKRGFTVWLDLEQMSGNVYVRMCEAVLGSKVVIPCMSKTYEASGNCKRELGFAADQTNAGKKIVPVRLDDGPFTWTALITSGLLYTYIGAKQVSNDQNWEEAMDGLAKEVSAVVGARHPPSALPPTDDQLFEAAVQESTQKQNLNLFDCMLSYNWAQQKAVIRMRDSLEQRGLKVWFDLDNMSGNVYSKMSEAVLGSKVVVSCLSTTYEASGNCRRELNFAYSQVPNGKKIIPIEFSEGPFTWTNNVTQGLHRYSMTETVIESSDLWDILMDELVVKIRELVSESSAVIPAVTAAPANTVPAASKETVVVQPVTPVTATVAVSTNTAALEARVAQLEQNQDALLKRISELEKLLVTQMQRGEKQSGVLSGLVKFIKS